MTIFGPDISSYEGGLNVSALADPFVMMKCTEGTYYVDADYAGWLAQAKSSGKLAVAYHFLKTESSPQAQAVYLAAHIIDKSLPVMLDIETEGSSSPNLAFVLNAVDAMRSAGLNVRLAYLPHWYWQNIGSPPLSGLQARGVGVVASAYPGRRGLAPATSYADSGGDSGTGWQPYGGVTPLLWQWTDAGVEQKSMDVNAYKGTIQQLAAFLHGSATTNAGDDVTPEEHNWLTNLYEGMFHGGSSCGVTVPAGHVGAGSNALFAHIGYMTQMLETLSAKPDPAPVDVAALAAQIVAAIEPHIVGADAQAVAVAVQAQLASALSGHAAG